MNAIHYLRSAGSSLCSAASKIANSILRPSAHTITTVVKVALFSAVFFSIMQTSEAAIDKFGLTKIESTDLTGYCKCDGKTVLYDPVSEFTNVDFAKMYENCNYFTNYAMSCFLKVDFSKHGNFAPDVMNQAEEGFKAFSNCMIRCMGEIEALIYVYTNTCRASFGHMPYAHEKYVYPNTCIASFGHMPHAHQKTDPFYLYANLIFEYKEYANEGF